MKIDGIFKHFLRALIRSIGIAFIYIGLKDFPYILSDGGITKNIFTLLLRLINLSTYIIAGYGLLRFKKWSFVGVFAIIIVSIIVPIYNLYYSTLPNLPTENFRFNSTVGYILIFLILLVFKDKIMSMSSHEESIDQNLKVIKHKRSVVELTITFFITSIFLTINYFITKDDPELFLLNTYSKWPTTVPISTPTPTSTPTIIPTPTEKPSQEEELLKYVPLNMPDKNFSDAYSGKYTTINSISEQTLFYMIYPNINEYCDLNDSCYKQYYLNINKDTPTNTYGCIKESTINQLLTSMYNKNGFNRNLDIVKVGGTSFRYFKDQGNSCYIELGVTGWYRPEKVNKIISYQTIGNTLTIYEKAAFVELSGDIYDTNSEHTRKLIQKTSNNFTESENFIENNWNLFKTFKHTFKLRNDGTYYWYSTETIK